MNEGTGRTTRMIDQVVASDARSIFVFCAYEHECDRIMRLTFEKVHEQDPKALILLARREIQRGDHRFIHFLPTADGHRTEERLMGIELTENSTFWDHFAAETASQRLRDYVAALSRRS